MKKIFYDSTQDPHQAGDTSRVVVQDVVCDSKRPRVSCVGATTTTSIRTDVHDNHKNIFVIFKPY